MPAFSVPENLAFDSYSDLSDAISDWMNRSDLTGATQVMIALAESRMRRELEPYFSETSSSVVVTDGVGAMPADFGTLLVARTDTATLPQISPAVAAEVPSGSLPRCYTIEDDALRLWPSCDATVTIVYRPTLSQLSETSPTNLILSKFPDLYFFGAMMFAEGYVANDNRAALFQSLFEQAIDGVKRYLVRQAFAGPLVPRLTCP